MAYVAGDIDRTFWRSSDPDFSRLLLNIIRWLRADAAPLLTIDGHGVIDTFMWETEPGHAVHLVNYTNPNMLRGWFREFYPIHTLNLDLQQPPGKTITKAQALRAERDLRITQRDGRLRIELPTLVDYEVIALT